MENQITIENVKTIEYIKETEKNIEREVFRKFITYKNKAKTKEEKENIIELTTELDNDIKNFFDKLLDKIQKQ